MRKRPQFRLDRSGFEASRAAAWSMGRSLIKWIRSRPPKPPSSTRHRKLEAIRIASEYSFETADMDRMLEEIESGYHTGGHLSRPDRRFDAGS